MQVLQLRFELLRRAEATWSESREAKRIAATDRVATENTG